MTTPVDPRPPRERIWVVHMLFKKNGAPSLGSFGQREAPVVIVPLEAWNRLCREIPALGQTQFEVGSID